MLCHENIMQQCLGVNFENLIKLYKVSQKHIYFLYAPGTVVKVAIILDPVSTHYKGTS